MKNAIIAVTLSIFICAVSASFGQDGGSPKIAVYITSGNSASEVKILSSRLLSALVSGGLFRPVERGDAFLEQIAKEQWKQRDGSVDSKEIKKIGRQFGVQYLCIGDLSSGFGITQISARVVDVETAEVIASGEAETEVESAAEIRGTVLSEMMESLTKKLTPSILRSMERR